MSADDTLPFFTTQEIQACLHGLKDATITYNADRQKLIIEKPAGKIPSDALLADRYSVLSLTVFESLIHEAAELWVPINRLFEDNRSTIEVEDSLRFETWVGNFDFKGNDGWLCIRSLDADSIVACVRECAAALAKADSEELQVFTQQVEKRYQRGDYRKNGEAVPKDQIADVTLFDTIDRDPRHDKKL